MHPKTAIHFLFLFIHYSTLFSISFSQNINPHYIRSGGACGYDSAVGTASCYNTSSMEVGAATPAPAPAPTPATRRQLAAILNSVTDKEALVSFKNSITFDPATAFMSTNWSDDTSVCNWIGVSCGLKHRRVTALDLSGYYLVGTVSPHLGNLTFLRYLDISSNNFTGILPSELSKLHRLKVMNVGVNELTGEIPTSLGILSQLQQLSLNNNSFTGTIPASLFNNSKLQVLHMSFNSLGGNIPKEIGNISSLKILNLHYNQLIGPIPQGIFNLSSMREIKLMNNGLTGSLPTHMCNNLPNLKTFAITNNQLSEEIPSSIWKCRGLQLLSLSINHFNGKIPSEIGSLSMLRQLYLGFNDIRGRIPPEIGNLSRLELLSINSAFLTGNIPLSIFNMSSLTILTLANNSLSGTLPSDMGRSLLNLQLLNLGINKFEGPIPASITNASKLTLLAIYSNSFSGSIPNFGNLRHLQNLQIFTNNLSGAEASTKELTFLSTLTNCPNLTDLGISENPLNGILPTSIGNLSTSLKFFWAKKTNMMGVIPSQIGNLSGLLDLNLAVNQLSGPIPSTIGELKKLERIYFSYNQLVGSIPIELCGMMNLGLLSLGDNMLVGPIPECLGDVKSLREIFLGSNKLNSTIPPNFWTLKDLTILELSTNNFMGPLSSQLGNLNTIYYLDLSFNQFSGDIPSVIDGCRDLEFLNMSNNQFRGSIPNAFGNIRGLVTLDLSRNNLLGPIPKSLEGLLFLQYFNVSYNKLDGRIPDGGCFRNFTAQSFVHNLDLCGSTRFQVQPCSQNGDRSTVKKNNSLLTKYIAPSLILVVIAVIVILVLIRRRKKESVDISPSMIEWRRISYIELERGTSSFSESNLLGRGSYGSVFEATLSDGLQVAAKVFKLELQRAVRSFDTETEIMGGIRHRNLVPLIGCCSNVEFKALILTYMPNGNLDKWLYSDMYHVDLIQRLNIAIDVASALEYLHHGYTFPVVHCDLKPSNVLLDGDMVAHLSDFGISKLFDGGEDFIQTQTLATIGYSSPELGSEGRVSINGDVYSFGIMLLEMFTGKRPTDDMFGGKMCLKEWVSEALQQNAAIETVAPALLSSEDQHFSAKEQCVSSIFELAMKCLAFSPNERINMIEAAVNLKKINARIVAATQR